MRYAALAVVALLLLAAAAFADGVILPGRAVVKPARTPDQRALLAFDGTTETLVIETTIQGEGREFAWIVPLPAAPKIEESTAGLFPTLEVMCGPDVIDRDDRLWMVAALVGAFAFAWARWGRRRDLPPWTPVLMGLLLVGAVLVVAVEVPTMREKGASGSGAVRVLSRESVGAFDTATLAANDAASLRAWLDENGFVAPAEIDPVADDYAKRGWVFVASKLRRETDDDAVRRIHPLAFTFATPRAVYPMRLTGAGNDSLALELFVAGPSGARARGLEVETCEPRLDMLSDDWSAYAHSELKRRAGGTKALTKLVGTLDREAMREDVEVQWVEAKERRDTYVSAAVARSIAASFAFVALFAVLVWSELRRETWPWRRRIEVALVASAAVGAVAWWLAPRLPSGSWEVQRGKERRGVHWHREPHEAFTDAAAARAWVASRTAGLVNPYFGEPVREEDSPGNWVVRDVDGLIELALFEGDRHGLHEWTINLSSSKAGDSGNVRSARTFALEGVVRTADGRPVVKADVLVVRADPRTKGRSRQWLHGAREAKTGVDGRFRFEDLTDEKWDVAVCDDRHAMLLLEDADPRRLVAPLALILPDGVALKGRLVGRGGTPIAGVFVLAKPETPFMHPTVRSAETDADGWFELPGFTAGSPDVEVTVRIPVEEGPDRFATFTATPGSRPVEFRLDLR